MNSRQTFETLDLAKRQTFLTLFVAGLSFWTSITSQIPTLPTYIQDVGGTTQQVGWVMGSFAIGLLLSRTWLGRIADRRSRKLVVLIGASVAAFAPLGYLWFDSIPGLMAIRAFHGISIAAFTTGYSSLVVDLSPIKQRGELIGYMSLCMPVGMAIGPALGSFIQDSFGYTFLFLVSAFCGLLAFLLASQVKEAKKSVNFSKNNTAVPSTRGFVTLISQPALLIPAIILLCIGLVFGTLVSFLPLYVRELDFSFQVGLFYTVAALASFLARFFVGQASDRYGRGIFITGSILCYGISMFMLAIAQNSTFLILAGIVEGLGAGVLIPMIIALISDRSYNYERGQVYSVCIGGFDLGIALAGPILGYMANLAFGYSGLFLTTSALSCVALIIFLAFGNGKPLHSLKFALGKSKDYYAVDN